MKMHPIREHGLSQRETVHLQAAESPDRGRLLSHSLVTDQYRHHQ